MSPGSALPDDAGLEVKAAARQRLAAGQGELDLDLDTSAAGGPLPVIASRMGGLLDALSRAYDVRGSGAGRDPQAGKRLRPHAG